MSYPYIIQGKNIILVVDNQSYTIAPDHINYDKISEAIREQDWSVIPDLVDPKRSIIKYTEGNVQIEGDRLLWQGKEIHNELSRRMIEILKDGFTITPWVNFMNNLMENPSMRAVNELYTFLERNRLPITPDGYFLAYKKVRADYTDCHSGTISNRVGEKPSMPRNEVDDDKDRTCSYGLHFCGLSYLDHFHGDRTMILKINPRDVVSIPSDYNGAKGRCCTYEVIGELGISASEAFTQSVQDNAYGVQDSTTTESFLHGYSDGWANIYYHAQSYTSSSDRADYDRGFDKGVEDRQNRTCPRFPLVEQAHEPNILPVLPEEDQLPTLSGVDILPVLPSDDEDLFVPDASPFPEINGVRDPAPEEWALLPVLPNTEDPFPKINFNDDHTGQP